MSDVNALLPEWVTCQKCCLGSTATNHVLGSGSIPCDLLFIGEAPGSKEDVIGKPFIGPSGRLLNEAIGWLRKLPVVPKVFITNLVACAPWLDKHSRKLRQPTPDEISECHPRLERIVEICKPHGIVLLGLVPRTTLVNFHCEIPRLTLVHPAFILRQGGMASSHYTSFVLQLNTFWREISKSNLLKEV